MLLEVIRKLQKICEIYRLNKNFIPTYTKKICMKILIKLYGLQSSSYKSHTNVDAL